MNFPITVEGKAICHKHETVKEVVDNINAKARMATITEMGTGGGRQYYSLQIDGWFWVNDKEEFIEFFKNIQKLTDYQLSDGNIFKFVAGNIDFETRLTKYRKDDPMKLMKDSLKQKTDFFKEFKK